MAIRETVACPHRKTTVDSRLKMVREYNEGVRQLERQLPVHTGRPQ